MPAETRVRHAARMAAEIGALQWSIGCALLPLTAVFFGEISVVGPRVNLVAIPLFNLVLVPLTLLATLLLQVDGLSTTLAPPVLHAGGWVAAHAGRAARELLCQPSVGAGRAPRSPGRRGGASRSRRSRYPRRRRRPSRSRQAGSH